MMDLGVMQGMAAIMIAVVSVPFLIVAAVLAWIAYRRRREAQDAVQGWSRTEGRILAAGVQSYLSRQTRQGGSTSMVTMYRPAVSYEYRAGGRSFTGNRLSMGLPLGYGSQKMAQRYVAKYSTGAPVQVYYNPANPEEAVLELKARGVGLLSGIAMTILAFVAVSVIGTGFMLYYVFGLIGRVVPRF